jgi:aspartate aminotransferase-like enzyme
MTKLFSPGPTPLSKETLEILSEPPIHHRSKAFKAVVQESMKLLKKIFDEEHIIAFPATGSGSLEASVVNFLNQNDHALYLDGGKFGARWGKIFEAYKISNTSVDFEWGSCPPEEKVNEALIKTKPQAVFMQACETSTGTAYDIESISKMIRSCCPESLLIVDGVTAVGAYEVSMKKLGVDVLITGSQKALGLPVGLSFMSFSDRAKQKSLNSDLPKFYFNALKELDALNKGTTVFSSPTQVWRALHLELQKLDTKKKYELCEALKMKIHNWAKENNIELFSKRPSSSLTALLMPSDISAKKVQKLLLDKGYYVATGQDQYSDRLIRIGHMANLNEDEMGELLLALKNSLKELGH